MVLSASNACMSPDALALEQTKWHEQLNVGGCATERLCLYMCVYVYIQLNQASGFDTMSEKLIQIASRQGCLIHYKTSC